MGLHDHFRPPLAQRRHWHSFHHAWAVAISAALNEVLPPSYFAEPNVQFRIEIDLAAFEGPPSRGSSGAVATAAQPVAAWSPGAPVRSVRFPLVQEDVEVRVFNTEAGAVLAGAIELVSPANKDRATHRQAFVSKCETYLQHAIGLVVVDIVTERRSHLHRELLERIDPSTATVSELDLYAAAYRVVARDEEPVLDVWEEPLGLGGDLPTMPLWLRGDLCIPVPLETTYRRVCREQRITDAVQ